MKRYTINLEKYISKSQKISVIKFLEISKNILNAFQIIHNAGYVYNNLKLQNIMISEKSDNKMKINLINFGIATSFLHKGKHIDQSATVETFKGNIILASLNHMNLYKTTRKDDLISLFYLMTILFNQFEMPFLYNNGDDDDLSETIGTLQEYKENNSLQKIASGVNVSFYYTSKHNEK